MARINGAAANTRAHRSPDKKTKKIDFISSESLSIPIGDQLKKVFLEAKMLPMGRALLARNTARAGSSTARGGAWRRRSICFDSNRNSFRDERERERERARSRNKECDSGCTRLCWPFPVRSERSVVFYGPTDLCESFELSIVTIRQRLAHSLSRHRGRREARLGPGRGRDGTRGEPRRALKRPWVETTSRGVPNGGSRA